MSTGDVKIRPGRASPAQTKIEGEIRIKVAVLIIIGATIALLIISGLVILFVIPDFFDSYFSKVLPIISGAIFGLTGFIVGQKVGSEK